MRRVDFVARGMWGLELGSRVAGDVEIGGRGFVEWDCGRGNTVDGCACEMLGVGLEGGGRKVVAEGIGVNIASCTDHFLATSYPFRDCTFHLLQPQHQLITVWRIRSLFWYKLQSSDLSV